MFETVASAIDASVDLLKRMPVGDALVEVIAAKARLEAAQIAITAKAHAEAAFVPDHRGVTGWAVEKARLDRREAKRFAALADRASRLPGFMSALEAGNVSVEHVEAVASSLRRVEDAVVADLEPILLEAAEVCTPRDLKELLVHIKTQADPEAASEGERTDFERRRLSISKTIDGSVAVSGHLDSVSGEWIMNALAAFSAPQPQSDGMPDPRTAGQRRVDAWVEISRRILGRTDADTRAGTAQMLLLVDGRSLVPDAIDVDDDLGPWEAPDLCDDGLDGDDGLDAYVPQLSLVPLVDDDDDAANDPRWWGEPGDDEAFYAQTASASCACGPHAGCDRAGLPLVGMTADGTALSPAAVLQLSCDARIAFAIVDDVGMALLPRALRRGKVEPMRLGRAQRVVSSGLRRALVLRDAGCVYPGCTMPPTWCEAHHLIPWELDGDTDLPNLALLCSFHHHQLHANGQNVRRRADGSWDVVNDPLIRDLLQRRHRHRHRDSEPHVA